MTETNFLSPAVLPLAFSKSQFGGNRFHFLLTSAHHKTDFGHLIFRMHTAVSSNNSACLVMPKATRDLECKRHTSPLLLRTTLHPPKLVNPGRVRSVPGTGFCFHCGFLGTFGENFTPALCEACLFLKTWTNQNPLKFCLLPPFPYS